MVYLPKQLALPSVSPSKHSTAEASETSLEQMAGRPVPNFLLSGSNFETVLLYNTLIH